MIAGNSADSRGGGVFFSKMSYPILTNCAIVGNYANYGGGVCLNESCYPTFINCTIAWNSAAEGGGLRLDYDCIPVLTNTILWGNSDSSGTSQSSQINRVELATTTVINYCCLQGWTGSLGGIGNIGDDPLFVDAVTGDYHLISGSPCIDTGDPNYIPRPGETDLDGNPRVKGDGVDMGAYEAGRTYHVDGVNGNNTNDGLTPETAFATIQRGINIAEDFDTLLVWPGVYNEEIGFWGDAITVKSAADAAIVETNYGYAFSFFSAEGSDTILSNFVIRSSQFGIYLINGASPTLRNLTIVNNDFGISAFNGADPDISNCILWGNKYGDLFRDPVPLQARYSCIEDGSEGEGNISIEPGFVDAAGGDYHLLSERGRYWPTHDVWVLDDVTSPCVDGGDPAVGPRREPMPNGGRINMGAYGGTTYAGMSEWPIKGDVNHDGRFNFVDVAILLEQWLNELPWAQ
jgi:parallel beta-helix repeat protein